MPSREAYFERWAAVHGGYDPRGSWLVRRWLGWTYVLARPLVAARVSPDAITVAGGAVSLVVVGLAALGGRWAVLAAAMVVVATLCDNLDGAVAVLTDRVTAWGAVLDALVDRVSDGLFLLALWLLGAPVWVCVAGGAVMMLHEYLRARATAAGMSEVGVLTVWERPTRIIVTGMFLLSAGVFVEAAAVWAGLGAAAWLGLGVVGFTQLVPVVRRRLDPGR